MNGPLRASKIAGRLNIAYTWSLGSAGTRFFESLKNDQQFLGLRCPSCRGVLVPPLPVCGKCFKKLDEWVRLPDTGTAHAIVPYLIDYPDQRLKPPILFAKIRLDGASTSFTHILKGLPEGPLPASLRVRARWREDRTGSLEDVGFFQPTG